MVRSACCEKTGLKKGPWTRDEDQILITYINRHGHGNWRALPKKAGLLRCGKSCRLRWTNYLRPDIKRGNFSKEEENTIIQLHDAWGNRWSAIAAKLPGRTDNEIKNVWHTHLKKRPLKQATSENQLQQHKDVAKFDNRPGPGGSEDTSSLTGSYRSPGQPNSPPHSSSSSDVSSSITTVINPENAEMNVVSANLESTPNLDDDFWLDVVSSENYDDSISFPLLSPAQAAVDCSLSFDSDERHDNMDFWSDLFARAEEMVQLPDL